MTIQDFLPEPDTASRGGALIDPREVLNRLDQVEAMMSSMVASIIRGSDEQGKRTQAMIAGVATAIGEVRVALNAYVEDSNSRFKFLGDELIRAHARIDTLNHQLAQMNTRIIDIESAARRRETDWNAQKAEVLNAMKEKIGPIIAAELEPAKKTMQQVTVTVGSLDRLADLLTEEKIALLKEAADEGVYNRIAAKKKQDSVHEIEVEAHVAETKTKGFEARFKPWQLVIGLVLMVFASLGGGAALQSCWHAHDSGAGGTHDGH